MDAARRLGVCNERGAALVYLAVALVVLMGMAALAIDMGYMYVGKAQLQNASDAAALAGAQGIKKNTNPMDTNQATARLQAVDMASKNLAAAKAVVLANSGANGEPMSPDNDITVGFWNFSGHTYSSPPPAGKPVNAIKVRARRTQDSPAGAIDTFFAKVVGKNSMDVSAISIAAVPSRAGIYTAFCTQACDPACSYNPNDPTSPDPNGDSDLWPAACKVEKKMETGPEGTVPYTNAFAWSSLLTPVTSTNVLRSDLLCVEAPFVDVCKQNIFSMMGASTEALRDLESIMYDPHIDGDNKTKNGAGVVTSWWVIVPITQDCPPGAQGGFDPKLVTSYAKIRIKSICSGGTAGCRSFSAPGGACPHTAANSMVIDRFLCIDCNYKDVLRGTRGALVK